MDVAGTFGFFLISFVKLTTIFGRFKEVVKKILKLYSFLEILICSTKVQSLTILKLFTRIKLLTIMKFSTFINDHETFNESEFVNDQRIVKYTKNFQIDVIYKICHLCAKTYICRYLQFMNS